MSKSNTNNPVDSVMSPEDIVIGCMMASENAARYISSNCNCDDFQSGDNRTIFMRFQVICNLVDKGVYPHATTDVLSIWFDESNNGPFKRALKLKEQVQHPDDYISYTALFKEARTKQRFITEMQSVLMRATEPDYPYIENARSLLSALESEQTIYSKPPEGLTIETVKASLAQTGEMGVITGFDTFDDICKGLRPKCLYVLGGLPSSGKSTLAENISVHAARQGNIVAYLSCEMGKSEIIQRAIRSLAPCDEEALSCHNSGSIHSINIEKAIQDVANLKNLYIDYSCTKDVDTICAYCKLIKSANGGRLDLIVIDHAQIVPPPKHLSKSDLRLQINYLSRRLKQFAMQEDTAVLLLSQLNRKASERDFKNYILGVIFYRYLSEKTESYMNDLLKDDGISYRDALKNEEYAPTVREWSIEHLGYIIEPKYLWATLIEEINGAEFSIEHFDKAISALVESTIGQESETAFDKLFDDMNLQDKDLGKEVSERTALIAKVMQKVDDISFDVDDAEMDVLGTAYMILISLFASDAGKKGGEFFTPTCASKLLARLATVGLDEVKNAADSCAGSGSLLLEVQNHLSTKKVGHFYATEKNGSNYNLLRMNLLMHGVPYKKFSCFNSDSIKTDNYYENGDPLMFDIQVENPPYSAKFDQSPKLLDDPRFSSCGVLAPQGKADLMFVESMVYHMSEDGRIAVLLPSGALFRGKQKKGGKNDAEYDIRRHLIENLNVVDAIIGLPAKMFHGAKLPVIVMVLKKKRNGNSDNILFIDASKYFTPEKTMNVITDEDIDRIVDAYVNRSEIDKFSHVAYMDELERNDYNCNIPRYVDSFEKEPPVDINAQTQIIQNCDVQSGEIDKQLSVFLKELGLEV